MKVNLRSRDKGKDSLTSDELKLVKEFTKWTMSKFVSKGIQKNLEITIRFDANLYKRDKSLGLAVWTDKHYMGREFLVEIDTPESARFLNIIHTLAHELVHVKQWTLGEYHPDMRGDDVYFYHGQKYDAKLMDYWDLPWEIEAHGRSMGLIMQWIDACGHGGQAWAKKKIDY